VGVGSAGARLPGRARGGLVVVDLVDNWMIWMVTPKVRFETTSYFRLRQCGTVIDGIFLSTF
jgi:hypothetical protein